MKKSLSILSLIIGFHSIAQNEVNDYSKIKHDSLDTYKPKLQQQPGLALAASKIFFSDKKWALSGFGEYNYVPIQNNVNIDVGDLELYYSGLYRQALFFGYKITDKLIWNSEFQIEFLHHKNTESMHEIVVEAFIDYLYSEYLKARVGFYPLTIGYVNNNDEPIMFYSVNRSEVERIIIPSTWIEFGVMFYGNMSEKWSYSLGLSQGLNSKNYQSGSWIRQGREIRFDLPKSVSVNPQINYHGIENLTLSASGYYGNSGQNEKVVIDHSDVEIKGRIQLTAAYAEYKWNNLKFLSVATYGNLGDTKKIYEQTKNQQGENGQVLGEKTFGYLFEFGCDILPYFNNKNTSGKIRKNFVFDEKEMKLSLFARYERLNTHHRVHNTLAHLPRLESDMNIWTFGINYNTKENIVLKANYQYRKNNSTLDPNPIKNIVETGLGFIF